MEETLKAKTVVIDKARQPSADKEAEDRSVSSATAIFRDILEGLYEGRFVPGQRLVETDLTSIYGVSRGSVREALNRLAAEGVVALNLHRGAHIRLLTQAEVEDILVLLELLIGLAARLAAQKLKDAAKSSEPRKNFLRICEQLIAFEDRPETYDLIRARNRFYRSLIDLGGNDALARVLPSMSVHLIRVQFRAFQSQVDKERFLDYRQIAEAVVAGDPRRAELAGRRHIRRLASGLKHVPANAFAPG
jgi:DNA-binding GntR family transcriptional regulator